MTLPLQGRPLLKKNPAKSSMFSYLFGNRRAGPRRDLVDVATSLQTSPKYMYELPLWKDKPVIPIEEVVTGYYLRFPCLDIPGVMGKIATVLGEHKINIESAHASVKEFRKDEKTSFVHIFTEPAREKDAIESIKKIKKFNVIRGDITFYRLLGDASNGIRNFGT